MEKNIGKTDKLIRLVLAVVFAVAGYMYSAWWYILSVILLFTVLTGFCMPYKWLGINTNKPKKK
jgi:hypothetical protein